MVKFKPIAAETADTILCPLCQNCDECQANGTMCMTIVVMQREMEEKHE